MTTPSEIPARPADPARIWNKPFTRHDTSVHASRAGDSPAADYKGYLGPCDSFTVRFLAGQLLQGCVGHAALYRRKCSFVNRLAFTLCCRNYVSGRVVGNDENLKITHVHVTSPHYRVEGRSVAISCKAPQQIPPTQPPISLISS